LMLFVCVVEDAWTVELLLYVSLSLLCFVFSTYKICD